VDSELTELLDRMYASADPPEHSDGSWSPQARVDGSPGVADTLPGAGMLNTSQMMTLMKFLAPSLGRASQFPLHTLHLTLYTLHSTLCTWQFALARSLFTSQALGLTLHRALLLLV